MKTNPYSRLIPLLFLATAPLALAHPGHGPEQGAAAGFLHPLGGWDHILAMVAVGIWAAQLGGRALWRVPAAFVAAMAAGAVLGHFTGAVPGIEQTVAASVLILGLLVGTAARIPVGAGMALVGLFAVFHGMAHGAAIPVDADGLAYGAGFIGATALLHAAGLVLGVLTARSEPLVPRIAGWAMAACGAALLLS
jgi:urease accessory protein